MSIRRFSFLVALAVFAIPVHAQNLTVKNITFSGYATASEADLIAASGLNTSAAISAADLQAAAQKLNDTGLFTHITYKFDGRHLAFQLEPATNLLITRFDNFVWLTPDQLNTALRARVPLYQGSVVSGSGLERQLIEALTALAAEQHLTASIIVLPVVEEENRHTKAESFRMVTPPVSVSTLTIDGASAEQQPRLAPLMKAAVGGDFSLSATVEELRTAIVNVYRNRGFLDAQVTAIVNETPLMAPDKISVPIKATVVEGSQYRLGKMTLDGSVLMTQEEFAKRAYLKPGDLADQELLRRTLQMAGTPYRSKGYLRAKIGAVPELNASTHMVDYAIHIEPGDQFHMGKLEVANLSDAQRAKFLAVWKMNPGDAFDAGYAATFLVKNAASLHDLDGLSAGYKQSEHEDTKEVDLVVTFRKDRALQ